MIKNSILEGSLEIILKKLQLIQGGTCHFGYNGKSMGLHVTDQKGRDIWLKLVKGSSKAEKDILPVDYRWQETSLLKGRIMVKDDVICYSMFLFLEDQIYSPEPFLGSDITIPKNWFGELTDALESLQQLKIVKNTPSFINPKIIEKIFGITKRMPRVFLVTTHGDLHWANITKSPLKILDWETCGVGPQALDISMLYTTALDNDDVIEKMDSHFAVQLESPEGLWCQLYATSQSIDRYAQIKKYSKQVQKLKRHGNRLIRVLK